MSDIFTKKSSWFDFANEHNSKANADATKFKYGYQSYVSAAIYMAAGIPVPQSIQMDTDRIIGVHEHFKGLRQLYESETGLRQFYESGIESKKWLADILTECRDFAIEHSIDSDGLIKKVIELTEKNSWKSMSNGAEHEFMRHLQTNPPRIIEAVTDLIAWMRSTFGEPSWTSNKECNANVKNGGFVLFGLCAGRFPDDSSKNRALLGLRRIQGYELLLEKLKTISPQIEKLVSQKMDTDGFNLHLDLLENAEEFKRLKEIMGEHVAMIAQQSKNGLQTEKSAPVLIHSHSSDNNELNRIHSFLTAQNFRIDLQQLRRYHLSLQTRKFVVLSGISGTGKTWLAEMYAAAVDARVKVVPVAPNWTSNEDLLGYFNPLDKTYHDTEFSNFLREATQDFEEKGELAAQYHLVLDEMNLARVEYYFAKFLSLMELRTRSENGCALIELGNEKVLLPPNLYFIGTVNIDETTHGFADKVYDRAQLIEMGLTRETVVNHIGNAAHGKALLSIWDKVHVTAPFAFRVIDEIGAYVKASAELGVSWEDSLDEQIVQKILPKVKGTSNRTGEILEFLIADFSDYKLTRAKAGVMLEGFRNHGFASYF